ncbi:MAG: heme exporter protein CcmB [Candidatus Puniceispirillales bacterium]|jgi:heme exporter protein B|nr:heme exporter protein CcmB [Alphaproteobacteria bacterium]MBL6850334.1 heme exporter protein CcmB [Alphaproteobacteria bacterium]
MTSSNSSWSFVFVTHLKRDFLINFRSLIDLVSIISFMFLIIILFILGVGPFKEKLEIIGNAIIWVGLILSIIPSLEKTLQKDFENGWFDQLATSSIPLEIVLLSRSISYWLIVMIPFLFAAPLFIILLNIELKAVPWLLLTMTIGSLAISLIGLNGASLILGAKRGNILLPILIIPLVIPILIFGVGVNEAIKMEADPISNLLLLVAFTLIYLVISPFISALLIRIAIAR